MKEETQALLDELILRPSSAFLVTIDENGDPAIRAIFNLRCKEKFAHAAKIIEKYDNNPYSIYISTNTSSIKMKHIENNPSVAVYFSLQDEVKGVMLKGKAEILEDMKFKEQIWTKGWEIYYPEGFKDPDFTIVKVKPTLLKGWYRGPHMHSFEE